jgi:hypothetical protein
MDVAMEEVKGQWQQRWCLTAAAAGGNHGRQYLMAAMDDGEGGSGDR